METKAIYQYIYHLLRESEASRVELAECAREKPLARQALVLFLQGLEMELDTLKEEYTAIYGHALNSYKSRVLCTNDFFMARGVWRLKIGYSRKDRYMNDNWLRWRKQQLAFYPAYLAPAFESYA